AFRRGMSSEATNSRAEWVMHTLTRRRSEPFGFHDWLARYRNARTSSYDSSCTSDNLNTFYDSDATSDFILLFTNVMYASNDDRTSNRGRSPTLVPDRKPPSGHEVRCGPRHVHYCLR